MLREPGVVEYDVAANHGILLETKTHQIRNCICTVLNGHKADMKRRPEYFNNSSFYARRSSLWEDVDGEMQVLCKDRLTNQDSGRTLENGWD